jgi:hypothetical protein
MAAKLQHNAIVVRLYCNDLKIPLTVGLNLPKPQCIHDLTRASPGREAWCGLQFANLERSPSMETLFKVRCNGRGKPPLYSNPSQRRHVVSIKAVMKANVPSMILNARATICFTSLLVAVVFCRAQSPSLPSSSAQAPVEGYAITQATLHSRVWQNSLGQSVTEIETGMNYWDGQQWTPSNPSFVVSPDGTAFVASQIQDPTQLAANINRVGAGGSSTDSAGRDSDP